MRAGMAGLHLSTSRPRLPLRRADRRSCCRHEKTSPLRLGRTAVRNLGIPDRAARLTIPIDPRRTPRSSESVRRDAKPPQVLRRLISAYIDERQGRPWRPEEVELHRASARPSGPEERKSPASAEPRTYVQSRMATGSRAAESLAHGSSIARDPGAIAMNAFPFGSLFDSEPGALERLRDRRGRERKPSRARVSDPARRYAMIAEAAYYRAQQRGFAPGHELEDWLEAEAELVPPARQPGRRR